MTDVSFLYNLRHVLKSENDAILLYYSQDNIFFNLFSSNHFL